MFQFKKVKRSNFFNFAFKIKKFELFIIKYENFTQLCITKFCLSQFKSNLILLFIKY